MVDDLLSGAGKGIIYTAALDPLLPGPPALRGALVGTAEYRSAPWGGLLRQMSNLSPVEWIPIVGALLDAGDAEDNPFRLTDLRARPGAPQRRRRGEGLSTTGTWCLQRE